MAGPIEMPFGIWTLVGPMKHILNGVQPGEHHWTIHVRRQCVLLSNYFDRLLWPPWGRNIFVLWFLLSIFFFPRLISAIADGMSTILPHMMWP